MEAPDKPTEITIEFSKGDPIALNQKKLDIYFRKTLKKSHRNFMIRKNL